MFDVEKIRLDFPVLHQVNHNGYPLIYLDNAATTQKPRLVVQCMEDFYYRDNANVHRGVHSLAARATEAYENSRKKVRAFLNAARAEEIIFVRGATEGINLVAQCFAGPRLKEGDEVLISAMEHHSNLVPWQQLCLQKKARLRVIPMNERGELQLENLGELLNERTRMAALVHISNALGTINPIEEVINQARRKNIPILIDAAQSAASYPIDVEALDCDFLVFSGHKVFGPDRHRRALRQAGTFRKHGALPVRRRNDRKRLF
jgi:cysteine desulfurase / selenocysteine lyase